MSRHFFFFCAIAFGFSALLSTGGCKKTDISVPSKKPIVEVAPVLTRPFDDGYKAGFEKGRAAAEPRAKVPSEDETEEKAKQAAGVDPQLNDKWKRGWADGYVAGFRDVAEGKK